MTKVYQPMAEGTNVLDGFGRCYSRIVYTSKELALDAVPEFVKRCVTERGEFDLGTLRRVDKTIVIELELHE